jgi:hypothetical protein
MTYDEGEPAAERVTAATREFELEDEQVFAGAGRGPTLSEERAAREAITSLTTSVVEHYREMIWRGSRQLGEGRISH